MSIRSDINSCEPELNIERFPSIPNIPIPIPEFDIIPAAVVRVVSKSRLLSESIMQLTIYMSE